MAHLMSKLTKKLKGMVKKTSGAVLFSMAVHGGLLLLAGGLVVFSVVQKPEKKFEPPPPVRRPKMELKKPKVKVKKQVQPKAAQRITLKNVQSVTDIQLPDVSSMIEGLGGGVGDFELMPSPSDVSLFGARSSISVGNDLEGTFYSLVLDRSGKFNGIGAGDYPQILRRFYDSGWNPRSFAPYYRWPQKLYTTFVFIPTIGFEHVPRSFGIPDEVNAERWVVHYRGKMMAHESGSYRFWGKGNDVLAVRVDGREVGFLGLSRVAHIASEWRSSAEEDRKYYTGKLTMGVGDWFELEANKSVDIDVVIGDYSGADTQATLRIQKKGEIYPKNRDGAPVLPVFKTAEIPRHLKDQIKYLTMAEDQDLDSEMIFNVY